MTDIVPFRNKPISQRPGLNISDMNSAVKVLEEGTLSDFFGSPGQYENGGKFVKSFEDRCAAVFGINMLFR